MSRSLHSNERSNKDKVTYYSISRSHKRSNKDKVTYYSMFRSLHSHERSNKDKVTYYSMFRSLHSWIRSSNQIEHLTLQDVYRNLISQPYQCHISKDVCKSIRSRPQGWHIYIWHRYMHQWDIHRPHRINSSGIVTTLAHNHIPQRPLFWFHFDSIHLMADDHYLCLESQGCLQVGLA